MLPKSVASDQWLVATKNQPGTSTTQHEKKRTPELGVRLGSFNPLAQASSRRTDWVADGFAGNEKFDSPVLLPAAGIVVRGYRQSVAEASG